MISNLLFGLLFIIVGASLVTGRMYGLAIPLEVIIGLALIFFGISQLASSSRTK